MVTTSLGPMARYGARSSSWTQARSGSPSWIGTAAPPLPTVALRNRSGCPATANSTALVPMSGPTTCGLASPNSSATRTMNSPMACGDSRSSRSSECPKPGRSTAVRWACSASLDQVAS